MSELEIGDDRQVIGSGEREQTAMNVDAFQFQQRIVIDVVQVQEREHAGVGACSAQTLFGFSAL